MHSVQPNTPSAPQRQRGFTLIELLIALVVVGILVAVALPSFMDSIRKGRRSEAVAALSAVQQAQERWRSSNGSYANNTQLTLPVTPASAGDPVGLGLQAVTPSGYYGIVISSASSTGYTATATAVAGSQASDGGCQVLAVEMNGGNIRYGSGASTATFPDANRCWVK